MIATAPPAPSPTKDQLERILDLSNLYYFGLAAPLIFPFNKELGGRCYSYQDCNRNSSTLQPSFAALARDVRAWAKGETHA